MEIHPAHQESDSSHPRGADQESNAGGEIDADSLVEAIVNLFIHCRLYQA